jgi:PAS domain-containing protein
MQSSPEPHTWMRELADVRLQAARLDDETQPSVRETLRISRRALELVDAIRRYAASAHQRCVALEQALAASERRAETVFDMLPVAVISTNTHGAILHANRAACTLLARGKPVLQRHPFLHFAEDREAFAAILAQLPAATGPIAATVRLRPCNRAPVDVAVTIVRDTADGSRWHWVLQPTSA